MMRNEWISLSVVRRRNVSSRSRRFCGIRTVAAAFEDDVFLRSRCRLNRVGGRLPTEAVMVLFRTFYCEVLHRQGLHHKLAGFAFGHESSEGFVDRASDRESESGIKAVLYAGEVLMAHKLYKRRGTSGTRASTYDLSHTERRVHRGSYVRRMSPVIWRITISVSIRELMRGVPSS